MNKTKGSAKKLSILSSAVYPYMEGLSNEDLTMLGYQYNNAVPEVPFIIEEDVIATALKMAEKGDGYILRVQEAGGKSSELVFRFADDRHVTPVNIIEKIIGKTSHGTTYKYNLHKHEIFTVLIQ